MKYLVLALLLFSHVASGQADTDAKSSEEWLQTISSNSLKAPEKDTKYKPANKGYALYFSEVDSVEVPYLVYVPESYNPEKSYPLVVYLHGGVVNLKNFEYKDPEFAEEPIFPVADKYNAIVLYPFGKKDFGWVRQQKAFENVLTMISKTKQLYHIDEQRVYLGGLSNGGSATFWFISHAPDQFAGFYTFSAYPELKTGEIKFSNIILNKPLYSVHAKDDTVYPLENIKNIYDLHKPEAAGWHLNVLDAGGHGFTYKENGEDIISQVLSKLLDHSK